MTAATIDQDAIPSGPARRRAGLALTALATLFLLFDAGIKIAGLPVVGETAVALGWPGDVGFWRGMGVLLLVCTILYAVPRTAMLGAILLTAYLGGAVAAHVRIGNPLFSHALFGVYIGTVMWGGLWLRDLRLRAILKI